ncbi:uncharacterized protein YecE (DUF72 family) [Rhizobium sp. BK619]|uniref:DUF72 domain-containing protein n=1 Tax=Rhizobium sp. BK619 TaxID=2586989 RepID=UPI00160E9308|nr:uncharacterized protein YecE (DUF72 family) [Rhizobium sp. BK619]
MPEMSTDEREKRKARREDRRRKQREANVERAAKMHEVRIGAPAEEAAIANGGPEGKVHIGCSGWYYWHWQGLFYPADAPRNQWFSFYEREFKTVELNAPFYAWPTVATVKTWLRQATGDFVYTIKVCELITHIRRFEDCGELIRDFGYVADMLGERMGCFLFQLPPSIRYSADTLHLILRQLDPCRRNVVEFRHKSWWNDEVFRQFEAAGAIFGSCSGPRLPDELVKTADDIYVRFHGTTRWYRHDYSEAELAVWADRIKSSGARTVWAYFNNDRDANAIKNAKMLSRLLGGT